MIIFAGIDGTSSEEGTAENPGDYQKSFQNSFVNCLQRNEWQEAQFDKTWYLRGPFTSGFDTRARAEKAYDWVVEQWEKNNAKAVFLGGYSRGAAAVLEVSKWLKYRKNIPVEGLILFDAVDRTNTLGNEGGNWGNVIFNTPIPDTVKWVIYPQRNIWTTHSRLSFGNCGFMRESNSTIFLHEKFFATHGGMGGTPWLKSVLPFTNIPNPTGLIWEPGEVLTSLVTPSADQAGAKRVENWTKEKLGFVFAECKARLEKENPVTANPGFQTPNYGGIGIQPGNGGGQRTYVVQPGDWLSKIAQKYYGDPMKYTVIHKANLGVIGPDPNVIKPGQKLIIP
ncbi:MAG: LysM peptidoglycan-binding domain-containing protein [Pyrinomonadaceae bacterium]|nr:LysM peptidoglycan-binding domain-containing protein [Pyrinomonadaceae bacterium]